MAKQTIFCKKCGKMHEIEDEKPTVFGTLLKWGGYGVVAVLAINFLAIIIFAALIFVMDGLTDSNTPTQAQPKRKNKCECGQEFEEEQGEE